METPKAREEAERWIDVAGKLLKARDLLGSQRCARKAQETDPTVDGIDQIKAIIDVLLAAEKRINNHLDWYAILQLDRRSNDLELIKRQYRKLALLLHPDKNKSPFSDNAFKFVCDAWAFLSDSNKKSLYDNEFNMFMKYDPIVLKNQQPSSPVRRNGREKRKTAKAVADTDEDVEIVEVRTPAQAQARLSTFWTVCPYCYHLYEYPKVYEDCCLRCQKCRRCFHAVVIPSPPPAIGHGKEMYYCCWAIFPIGFTTPENLAKNPNWSPFKSMFSEKEVEKESGSEHDEDDDRGGKKGKTESTNNNVSMNWSSVRIDTEKENKGSGNKFQGENVNVPDKGAQDGSGLANNMEPQKTVRIKTTARKSIPPRPNNKPVLEALDKINGGKSDSEWVGMNVNVNVPSKGVQVGSAANGEPQKTLRTKTTARKSTIKPKPSNKPVVEAPFEINGGKLDSEWVGMNLNLEVNAKQPKVADTVEGLVIESLDSEATEGIGFFEGLDDILGNLPMLAVPGDQKAQTSS